MRKLLFVILLLPALLCAQTTEFGYFSLKVVMDSLPEYSEAQNNYNSLLELCDAEIAQGEETLTRNYVSFLDGQNTFPEPILRRRQKELQELVDRNVVLRDQLNEWLVQAHDSLFAPIVQKIDAAIERVCLRNNLAYAIDTDKEAYRFVHPDYGVNITRLIIKEVVSPTTAQMEQNTPRIAPAVTFDAENSDTVPCNKEPLEDVIMEESDSVTVTIVEE